MTAGRQILLESFGCCVRPKKPSESPSSAGTRAQSGRGALRVRRQCRFVPLLPPGLPQLSRPLSEVEVQLQSLSRPGQQAGLEDRRSILADAGPAPFPFSLSPSSRLASGGSAARSSPCLRQVINWSNSPKTASCCFATMRSRLLEVIIAACATAAFTPKVAQEALHIHTLGARGCRSGAMTLYRTCRSLAKKGACFRFVRLNRPGRHSMN